MGQTKDRLTVTLIRPDSTEFVAKLHRPTGAMYDQLLDLLSEKENRAIERRRRFPEFSAYLTAVEAEDAEGKSVVLREHSDTLRDQVTIAQREAREDEKRYALRIVRMAVDRSGLTVDDATLVDEPADGDFWGQCQDMEHIADAANSFRGALRL